WVNLVDLRADYAINKRFGITVSLPYEIAERSLPVMLNGAVATRYTQHANGIGDVMLIGRGWIVDPAAMPHANLQLGLGLKIPTGETAALSPREKLDASGNPTWDMITADQSIQPGDGGVGVLLQLEGFWDVWSSSS